MSASIAVTAVYNMLKDIAGVGPNVYPQIRFSNDDATFNALFVDSVTDPVNPIVRAWMVSREASPGSDTISTNAWSARHSIVMTGFMSFKDGVSEPVWQAQIDAIFAAFGALTARHFGGEFDWSGPPQVEGVKLVMFRNVLCHTARIVHPVEEFPLS